MSESKDLSNVVFDIFKQNDQLNSDHFFLYDVANAFINFAKEERQFIADQKVEMAELYNKMVDLQAKINVNRLKFQKQHMEDCKQAEESIVEGIKQYIVDFEKVIDEKFKNKPVNPDVAPLSRETLKEIDDVLNDVEEKLPSNYQDSDEVLGVPDKNLTTKALNCISKYMVDTCKETESIKDDISLIKECLIHNKKEEIDSTFEAVIGCLKESKNCIENLSHNSILNRQDLSLIKKCLISNKTDVEEIKRDLNSDRISFHNTLNEIKKEVNSSTLILKTHMLQYCGNYDIDPRLITEKCGE